MKSQEIRELLVRRTAGLQGEHLGASSLGEAEVQLLIPHNVL